MSLSFMTLLFMSASAAPQLPHSPSLECQTSVSGMCDEGNVLLREINSCIHTVSLYQMAEKTWRIVLNNHDYAGERGYEIQSLDFEASVNFDGSFRSSQQIVKGEYHSNHLLTGKLLHEGHTGKLQFSLGSTVFDELDCYASGE